MERRSLCKNVKITEVPTGTNGLLVDPHTYTEVETRISTTEMTSAQLHKVRLATFMRIRQTEIIDFVCIWMQLLIITLVWSHKVMFDSQISIISC